jgi:hypothetical protein
MTWVHDALIAAVTSSRTRLDVLDDIALPGWLERRLGWGKRRDARRLRRAERSGELPPQGKDATKDW